jgi:Holliday junction resolvasome RuvABC endonuclease subunit
MKYRRVLGIDPTSRGFGYIIFEGKTPIDWGNTCSGDNREAAILERLTALEKRWSPDALIIEDYHATGNKRCLRVKLLLAAVEKQVAAIELPTFRISHWSLKRKFQKYGARTKHQRAELVASLFPVLHPRLPRKRKPWMSEADRMSIFVAAGMVMTFLSARKGFPDADWRRASNLGGSSATPETRPLGQPDTPDTNPRTR